MPGLPIFLPNFGKIFTPDGRLKRGITEETAQNKIAKEFQRNLNITKITCYFMDTVFWRNEQRIAEKGAMTTLQSSYSLAGAIFKEPYDPLSNTSTPKIEQKFCNKKPPSAPPKHQTQYQVELNILQ